MSRYITHSPLKPFDEYNQMKRKYGSVPESPPDPRVAEIMSDESLTNTQKGESIARLFINK